MKTYTDEQLKRTLVKLLPEKVGQYRLEPNKFYWRDADCTEILDTELLHLCWLVEETLGETGMYNYYMHLPTSVYNFGYKVMHISWQQRTIALAKTKGIEIV